MKTATLASILALALFVSAPAFATDAAAPAATPSPSATPSPTMTAKPDAAAKKLKSEECTKEADAKGLHGKERKAFRSKCKKGM